MKKLIITLLLSTLISHGFSQWIKDFSGRPYRTFNDNELQGSPFLFGEWRTAKIKLKDVGEFDDVMVKFNPFNNSFYYNKNDSLYEFLNEVEEVRLKDKAHLNERGYDMVFTKDIPAGDKIPPGTFVQVLSKGKITLVKYFKSKLEENLGNGTYGGEGKVRKLVVRSSFIAFKDNKAETIQFSLKNLERLTADREVAMTNFLNKKDLNLKNEMDFSVAISYYNLISQ